MIYIIDDAVTPSIADKMEREIVPELYYKYMYKTTGVPKEVSTYSDERTYDRGQLVAPVLSDGYKSFPSSDAYPLTEMILLSCLDKLNMKLDKAKRIKINMLRREDFPEDHYNIPHIDSMDGRVTPKKNRAVLFESNRMHASSNPLINEERYVINFMFNCK
jgi:hypothetical protein